MIDVFLLLGSNLGDCKQYLIEASNSLEIEVGHVIKRSSVYQTQAWGKTDEPDFLNQVLYLQTSLSAPQVLHTILNIEKNLGRERKEKWGSRTIDIDILFYGNQIINQPGLTIPHERLHERKFVLEPLTEIAPDFIHPLLEKTILTLNEFQDRLIVKKL